MFVSTQADAEPAARAEVRQKWGALLRTLDQWAPLEPRDTACDLSTVEMPLAQTNLKGMDKTTQSAAWNKAAFLEISPRTSRPTVLLRRQRGLTCCSTKRHLLWVRQWLGREQPGNCCPKGLEAQPATHGFLHKSWSGAEATNCMNVVYPQIPSHFRADPPRSSGYSDEELCPLQCNPNSRCPPA